MTEELNVRTDTGLELVEEPKKTKKEKKEKKKSDNVVPPIIAIVISALSWAYVYFTDSIGALYEMAEKALSKGEGATGGLIGAADYYNSFADAVGSQALAVGIIVGLILMTILGVVGIISLIVRLFRKLKNKITG